MGPALAAIACAVGLSAPGCRPAEDRRAVVRGAPDVQAESDGSFTPVVLEFPRTLGLCLGGAFGKNLEAALALGAPPDAKSWPAQAAETVAGESTLCIVREIPAPPAAAGPIRLCAQTRDRRTRAVSPPVCRTLLYRQDKARRYASLVAGLRRAETMAESPGRRGLLDRVAREAEGTFLFLPVHARLQAIESCLGDGELDEARRRLAELARLRWLAQVPEAAGLAAKAAILGARLELDAGALHEAARHLQEAAAFCEKVGCSLGIEAALRQAEILWSVGAADEAVAQTRRAQDLCPRCRMAAAIASDLAWYILAEPDVEDGALTEAEHLLTAALGQAATPQERANRLINLALLRVRRGAAPAAELAEARRLLAARPEEQEGGGPRLLAWTDLIEAQGDLARGQTGRALERCGRLARRPRVPALIKALAFTCAGKAERQSHRIAAAAASFERALRQYEYAEPEKLERDIPLGPGQRADAFYESARLAAVEEHDPRKSQKILDRLENLVADESCIASLKPAERERLRQRNRQMQERLQAAGERDPGALARLQETARELPCRRTDRPVPAAGVEVRAVPLEDGVLVLVSRPDGPVGSQWTPESRGALRRTIAGIDRQLDDGAPGAVDWRPDLERLARALLPEGIEAMGPRVTFSLYGILQGAPLQALPLPRPARAGEVLADRVTVVLKPAALHTPRTPPAAPHDRPPRALFVVDPQANLAASGQAAAFYRQYFPAATLLVGERATGLALRQALARADLFHFDGHGLYEAAFPELSRLKLAGDDVLAPFQILDAPVPAQLVNLSGCKTGRFPVTADSGRYGLAGAFARLGTAWVIASRNDLDDEVARAFNRVFYVHLAQGRGVPESYTAALAAVRERFPRPASWGGLFLLRGAGGQMPASRTPS